MAGLVKDGLHPCYHALDITDETSIIELRDYMKEKYGGIDVLVNNAGVAFPVDTTETFGIQAKLTLDVNYWGNKAKIKLLLRYA